MAGKEGIALIVGTGSSCYGRTSGNNDWMAGGWEHLLDDRGIAYDLTQRGLRAVVQAADGRGAAKALTDVLLDALEIDRMHEIINRIHVGGPFGGLMDKKEIASLASLVTEAASNDDEVAAWIIREGINELVLMVKTVAEKLEFTTKPIPLVVSGGTVSGSSSLKRELHTRLASSLPQISIEKPRLSPLMGSVLLSMQMIRIEIDQSAIENLISSASVDFDNDSSVL